MGLLGKLFGGKENRQDASGPPSSGLDEDEGETTTGHSTRNTPRRELVQVVLRDTMRRHGIPSDWIECRILSVQSTTRGSGMHVLLAIKQGEDRLATYVHAFQNSFLQELVRLEPRAIDWIFSISWQFEGKGEGQSAMPDPASWNGGAGKDAPPPGPPAAADDERSGPDTVTTPDRVGPRSGRTAPPPRPSCRSRPTRARTATGLPGGASPATELHPRARRQTDPAGPVTPAQPARPPRSAP